MEPQIPVIFTDGGCKGNPGPMGLGVVVIQNGTVLARIQERPAELGTNNIAEYKAIIRALEHCISQGYTEIILKSDSNLCIGQLSKGWKINHEHLRLLYSHVKELEKSIKVNYQYIPREQNLADQLSNMGIQT